MSAAAGPPTSLPLPLPLPPAARTNNLSLSRFCRLRQDAICRAEPGRFASILSQIPAGSYVEVISERGGGNDSMLWLQLKCGWINGREASSGVDIAEDVPKEDCLQNWQREEDHRHRVSAAIVGMLTKSHSLENARRVARAMLKHCKKTETASSLMCDTVVCVEELLIALSAAVGLRQAEVYEFAKVAACQQSNPKGALWAICEEVNTLTNMRPSMWVKNNLPVLSTDYQRRANDQFVMSAARGDVKALREAIQRGQEVSVTHSELAYTALHSATEFGHKSVIQLLLDTGLSSNIRDVRHGKTALHYAAEGGRSEIAEYLLDRGADRTIRTSKGNGQLAPFELAESHGHYECREILKFPPPEIQSVQVVEFGARFITLRWLPPAIHENMHSRVQEFMVEWRPIVPLHYSNSNNISNNSNNNNSSNNKNSNDFTKSSLFNALGDTFKTPDTTLTIQNLLPSTGHSFFVYSRSLSGWSKPSGKKIQFTMPAVPEALPPPEILRISKNGMFLSWEAPVYDNGGKIDSYQLEILDETAAKGKALESESEIESQMQSKEDDSGDDTEQEQVEQIKNTSEEADVDTPEAGPNGFYSHMLHRLMKHTKIADLKKQVTGLEPNRPYLCRIRAHNQFGYGPWSIWTKPVRPNSGIAVTEFSPALASVTISWFEPIVTRPVTAYELQICPLKGPVFKEIFLDPLKQEQSRGPPVFHRSQQPVDAQTAGILEYVTLANDLVVNSYTINGLQAGGKYKFRVRCQVDGKWADWTLSFQSDVITMPASLPDPPFNVGPAILTKTKSKIQKTPRSSENDGLNDEIDAIGTISDANKQGKSDDYTITGAEEEGQISHSSRNNNSSEIEEHKESSLSTSTAAVQYDIAHDFIVVSWKNGSANASPVTAFQIAMAKVRDYRIADLKKARAAMLHTADIEIGAGIAELHLSDDASEDAITLLQPSAESSLEILDDPHTVAELNRGLDDEILQLSYQQSNNRALQWRDVTQFGEFMGPEAFRVRQLIPGSSYIFRVRQKNAIGWSHFSKASAVVQTYPTVPPGRPRVHRIGSYFATVLWSEGGALDGLMNLEYDLHVGVLDKAYEKLYSNRNDDDEDDNLKLNLPADAVDWAQPQTITRTITPMQQEKQEPSNSTSATGETELELEHAGGPPVKTMEVQVEHLTPSTLYVVRTRVRTIAGWSTWSDLSKPFSTLSN